MKSKITQEFLKSILHYDPLTGDFTWLQSYNNQVTGKRAGEKSRKNGYRVVKIEGRVYYAHRLAWLYMLGSFPEKMIDHKNEVKTDNWFSNLRDTTNTVNSHNQSKPTARNKVGARGVFPYLGAQFQAQIQVKGKRIHLGVFKTLHEASVAYAKGKSKYHAQPTLGKNT